MDLLEKHSKLDLNHWYYYSKFRLSLNILSSVSINPSSSAHNTIMVDVGAGSGVFIKAFFNAFNATVNKAYAIDKYYKRGDLGIHDNVYFCRELPEGIKPNFIFFMDILEHLENDKDFLKSWVEIASKDSIFLFTVPAFKWLWSDHDLFLKHKKRYSLKDLEKVVSSAGLNVLKGRYFYTSIFAIVFLKRKIIEPLCKKCGIVFEQGIKPSNNFNNLILKAILNIEIVIGKLNRIFGLTCIVIAKKE